MQLLIALQSIRESRHQNVFILNLLELRMMEVVTTGAIIVQTVKSSPTTNQHPTIKWESESMWERDFQPKTKSNTVLLLHFIGQLQHDNSQQPLKLAQNVHLTLFLHVYPTVSSMSTVQLWSITCANLLRHNMFCICQRSTTAFSL